ncbi:hypothetical protein EVAR_102703_1 [Eumeta japonica]|uniref:Uncharacterized protein n=1 Tax=Eumeta variegata TaxID=151549 RepID=A0A4C1TIR7_EUMVA|nr:hypothetical protein EVAR_102703_1 [Eumeta japonica]
MNRCDSEHTAELLHAHLQALVDRPENQKKFADIERKLRQRGALPTKPPDSSLGSEVSTRESDSGSTEERCVANLYDSLAAELKQKLSTGKRGIGKSPILLPPRDYDTVHRQKGNLSNIDTRRCLNQNIVGVNARRKLESSGGSSGIGSDLAPSPDRNDYRHNDNHSTSEEEWAESTAYMMHEAYDASPPRRALTPPRRGHESPSRTRDRHDPYRERRQRQPSPDRDHDRYDGAQRRLERDHERERDDWRAARLQRGVSEGSLQLADASPRDRFHVAKEKFMNLERERFTRELEMRMAQRRSALEARARSPASPEERRPERLPRVTRARAAPAPAQHYDDELEFERYERERYERRRDEPEERSGARREWRAGAGAGAGADGRQRAFSRSRLLDEQRQQRQSYAEERPYYDREFRDLPERAPAKFRHSYAEPLARARLPALRPY